MKRLSISLSVILLAFLVLLGSGGFTIGKMICGGNACTSTYTLGKAKACCSSEKSSAETQLKSCCCELVDVSYNLDEFSVSEKVNVAAQELDLHYLPTAYNQLPAFFVSKISYRFTDTSPPDPRGYLYFIGSLLL